MDYGLQAIIMGPESKPLQIMVSPREWKYGHLHQSNMEMKPRIEVHSRYKLIRLRIPAWWVAISPILAIHSHH